ncbi:MAG: hypothetical protein AMJ53_13750 [Gammaproteobacteria bacterium SG8_11]|nr:MAG: hypothetical protein AMJ53_13750 [Gammaproteobacteria bacterium SG8_11]
MPTLASQPQTIGKVLDDAFKFYVKNLVSILPLSILTVVTPVAAIISFVGVESYFSLSSGQIDPATIDFTNLGSGGLIATLLFVFFYAAMFYKMTAAAQDHPMGIGASLGLGVKATIPLLITYILFVVAVTLGMILLVIPGIIVMVSLILFLPAYTMDNAGIIGSLKKSHNLVWGNWWRTLLILSVPVIILSVIVAGVIMVVGIVFGISAVEGEGDLLQLQIMMEVAQQIVNIFIYPLFPALMIILYNDLKLRKEGADLDAKISGTASI